MAEDTNKHEAKIKRLMQGLRKARAAGNPDDAKYLAERIREEQIGILGESGPSVGEAVAGAAKGTAETAATFGSGAVSEPLAGLSGIKTLIQGGNLDEAVKTIEDVQNRFTYAPRSEEGSRVAQEVGSPFQALAEGAETAGEFTLEQTGSPEAATAVDVGIQSMPLQTRLTAREGGTIPAGMRALSRTKIPEQVAEEGRSIGFDVKATPDQQREQIIAEAERQTQDIGARGDAFSPEGGNIVGDIQTRRQEERERVNRLYEQARSDEALVPDFNVQEFAQKAQGSLRERGFDLPQMPYVQRRVKDIDNVVRDAQEEGFVDIGELYNIRKRINQNRPAKNDESQSAALNQLKGELDSFLQDQFENQMILGDQSAIKKWQKAIADHSEFKRRFDEDKTVRKIAQEELDPSEVSKMVFGTSEANMGKTSSRIVRKIKDIVGKDSKRFDALRQEFLFQVADPLFQENPNFGKFVKDAKKLQKRNPEIIREFFPDKKQFDKLVNFARAADRTGSEKAALNVDRAIAAFTTGHGIAKGAARQGIAERAIAAIRGATPGRQRRKVVADYLGYDPNTPIFRNLDVPTQSSQSTAQELPPMPQTQEETAEFIRRHGLIGGDKDRESKGPAFVR